MDYGRLVQFKCNMNGNLKTSKIMQQTSLCFCFMNHSIYQLQGFLFHVGKRFGHHLFTALELVIFGQFPKRPQCDALYFRCNHQVLLGFQIRIIYQAPFKRICYKIVVLRPNAECSTDNVGELKHYVYQSSSKRKTNLLTVRILFCAHCFDFSRLGGYYYWNVFDIMLCFCFLLSEYSRIFGRHLAIYSNCFVSHSTRVFSGGMVSLVRSLMLQLSCWSLPVFLANGMLIFQECFTGRHLSYR